MRDHLPKIAFVTGILIVMFVLSVPMISAEEKLMGKTVNINRATAEELAKVPLISPKLAQAILDPLVLRCVVVGPREDPVQIPGPHLQLVHPPARLRAIGETLIDTCQPSGCQGPTRPTKRPRGRGAAARR